MKPQNILLFLFFLTQSITLSAQQYLPSFQEIKNYETIQLDNGFTILNVSTSNQDTVYFHFASRVNSSTNPKYTSNIFFIQQLFGFYTSKMTIGDLNALKQTLQIEHNRKGTEIYLSGNTTNSDTLFHLLSLLAIQPIIKQSSFDSLKQKELTIIEANKIIIDSVASIFLRKDYFAKKHFLGNTADAASIKQVTINSCHEFIQNNITPENSFLVVFGSLSDSLLTVLGNKHFGNWKKKPLSKIKYTYSGYKYPKTAFIDSLQPQSTFIHMLQYQTINQSDFKEQAKYLITKQLLSHPTDGIIAKKLMIEKNLSTGFYTNFAESKAGSYWSLSTRIVNNYTDSTIREIRQTMQSLRDTLVSDALLRKAIENTKIEYKQTTRTQQTIANRLIFTHLRKLETGYFENLERQFDLINKEDIQNFAQNYFDLSKIGTVIIGNTEVNQNEIRKTANYSEINFYDNTGNITQTLPLGFSANNIIIKYLNTCGGIKNISKVKNLIINLRGFYYIDDQVIRTELRFNYKGKRYLSLWLMHHQNEDSVLIKQQIFDGTHGFDSTKQEGRLLKDKELEILKYRSIFGLENKYEDLGIKTQIIQLDSLQNEEVYQIKIISPSGLFHYDFFSEKTGQKLQSIYPVTDYRPHEIRIEYADYKAINKDGVLVAHRQTIYTNDIIIKLRISDVVTKPKYNKHFFKINENLIK